MAEQEPIRLNINMAEMIEGLGVPPLKAEEVYAQLQERVRQAPQLNEHDKLVDIVCDIMEARGLQSWRGDPVGRLREPGTWE